MKRIAVIKIPIKWEEKQIVVTHEDYCPFRVSRYTEYNAGVPCDFCTHEKFKNEDDELDGVYCEGIRDNKCPLEKVD